MSYVHILVCVLKKLLDAPTMKKSSVVMKRKDITEHEDKSMSLHLSMTVTHLKVALG